MEQSWDGLTGGSLSANGGRGRGQMGLPCRLGKGIPNCAPELEVPRGWGTCPMPGWGTGRRMCKMQKRFCKSNMLGLLQKAGREVAGRQEVVVSCPWAQCSPPRESTMQRQRQDNKRKARQNESSSWEHNENAEGLGCQGRGSGLLISILLSEFRRCLRDLPPLTIRREVVGKSRMDDDP